MLTKRPGGLMAMIAVALMSTSTAYAADGEAFAQRLKTLLAAQTIELDYSGVDTAGDDVTLRGVKAGSEGQAADLGDLTFENVDGTTETGFTAQRLAVADVDRTEEESRLTVQGILVEGIKLAGTQQAGDATLPTNLQFERAGFDSLAVQHSGKDVVTIGATEMTSDGTSDGGLSGAFTLADLVIDTTVEPESEGARTMAAIGYPQIRGDVSGNAAWNPADGRLTLDPLTINWADAGELNFAYTITGYTPAFIQQLSQLQAQMSANPEGNDATGMAMLGLISQLYLNDARLAFTDNSLTGKLLDHYAERNGQSRDQLVTGLTGALPGLLAYLQNPDFQQKVQDAVGSYLADPENITISIAPQTPVPATQVIGAAMGAPQTLPEVLQLQVTSNQ